MAKSSFKSKVKPISAAQAKVNYEKLDAAIRNFAGDVDELEAALGMYLLGRHWGWRPLVIIHNKRTIRKYEEILGINIREEFEEEGPDAERPNGYRFAKKLSNFWKAVSGDEPVENRRTVD
jgi:hypothetical protein